MFERFTQEARQVVILAQEEARQLRHSYIGTEHVLLGLLRAEEERDDEERPLGSLGLTLSGARKEIARIVRPGEGGPVADRIPFTPRAKRVLELAFREALVHGHQWIEPDHILLGLARENGGVASRVLHEADAYPERVRERVSWALGAAARPESHTEAGRGLSTHLDGDPDWVGRLGWVLASLAREIPAQLGRDPDLGDLLLVISCARGSIGAQALSHLGVDPGAVSAALERLRRGEASAGQAPEVLPQDVLAEVRRQLGLRNPGA